MQSNEAEKKKKRMQLFAPLHFIQPAGTAAIHLQNKLLLKLFQFRHFFPSTTVEQLKNTRNENYHFRQPKDQNLVTVMISRRIFWGVEKRIVLGQHQQC